MSTLQIAAAPPAEEQSRSDRLADPAAHAQTRAVNDWRAAPTCSGPLTGSPTPDLRKKRRWKRLVRAGALEVLVAALEVEPAAHDSLDAVALGSLLEGAGDVEVLCGSL